MLVLAVASLWLSGLPDDVLAWATRPAPVDALLLRILWPPAAVVTVTVVLVGSMVPPLVAAQSNSAAARGLLAVVVTFAGIVLWLPILGRVPGIPRPRPMIRAVYLIGLNRLADQQVAGFVSKLSFLLTLLTVAGVILAQAPDTDEDLGPEDPLVWSDIERHFERADRRARGATGPAAGSGRAGAAAPDGAGPQDLATGAPGDEGTGRDGEQAPG